MAAALAGLAVPGWAQAQEAAPSQTAAQPAGVSLRLETELRERNLLSSAQRPVFARGAVVGGRTDRETTLQGDAEIRHGMYGLHQAGKLANDQLAHFLLLHRL
jgi:hypothetical protein